MAYYPANARYHKKNIVTVSIGLNRKNDGDIIDFMEGMKNKSGYLKELIRADMAKRKNDL